MRQVPVDHEARRTALADAMVVIVAEHGLEAATVRAIAEAAGVSIGTVQHYFPSKDEFLVYAYRHTGEQLAARVDEIVARARSTRGAIRDILLELLPLDARRRAALRVGIAFSTRAMTEPQLADVLRDDLDELRRGLAEGFAEAKLPEPKREAAIAIAVVDGLATQLLFGGGVFTASDAVEALDTHLQRIFMSERRGRR